MSGFGFQLLIKFVNKGDHNFSLVDDLLAVLVAHITLSQPDVDLVSQLLKELETILNHSVKHVALLDGFAEFFKVLKAGLIFYQRSILAGTVEPVNGFVDFSDEGLAYILHGVLFVVSVLHKVVAEFVRVGFEVIFRLFQVKELAILNC